MFQSPSLSLASHGLPDVSYSSPGTPLMPGQHLTSSLSPGASASVASIKSSLSQSQVHVYMYVCVLKICID